MFHTNFERQQITKSFIKRIREKNVNLDFESVRKIRTYIESAYIKLKFVGIRPLSRMFSYFFSIPIVSYVLFKIKNTKTNCGLYRNDSSSKFSTR